MKRTFFLKGLELLAVIGFLSVFYLTDLQSVDFHIDESHWIGTSYMFEAYVKGQFWSDAWRESQPTLTNPPVPRYVIGLSRLIGGYHIPDLNRRWDYNYNTGYNLRRGAMPSDGLLWWSRLPMAVLAVGSLAMGFFLLKKVSGRPASYLWILFGVASPYLLLQTRRAMAESSILFLVILAVLTCYLALDVLRKSPEKVPWQTYTWLGLCGVCIGLAGESKINGLSILFGVVVCLIAFFFWVQKETPVRNLRRVLVCSVLVCAVTALVFLGSYPYLWPNPLGRTIKMTQNRLDEMRYQSDHHPSDAINTLEQRLTLIPKRIFQDYAVIRFEGAWALNLSLTLLGTGLILAKARDWLKGSEDDPAALVLLATAFTAAAPAFLTLLDWDRYYLFPVFFSTAFIVIGLGWLGTRAISWGKQMQMMKNLGEEK